MIKNNKGKSIMYQILIAFFIVTSVLADPEPIGGAPCRTAIDCGGVGANSVCYNSTCQCDYRRAKPDCSYQRVNRNWAGGLQFFTFAGVGGIGNLYAGRKTPGIVQICLQSAYALIELVAIILCFVGCIAACVGCCCVCYKAVGDGDSGPDCDFNPLGFMKEGFAMASACLGATAAGCLLCLIGGATFAGFLWSFIDGIMIFTGSIKTDGHGFNFYIPQ